MSDGSTMDLGGGTGSSYQFVNAGDSVTGRISEFSSVPQTHYEGDKRGEPRFFSDGKPMTMVHVELQTALRNGEGLKEAIPAGSDDGMRSVFLKANKKPDTTSTMNAVILAATAAVGKGSISIGGTLTLTMTGEVKSHTGQLAKAYTARYVAPSVDLGAAAVPTPAPVAATPAPTATVPAAPVPAPAGVLDPMMPHITDPKQRTALNLPPLPGAVPPPPVAVPAPPVAVPPPPPAAVKTTPEGLTLEQLVGGGWTREQAIAAYPVLA